MADFGFNTNGMAGIGAPSQAYSQPGANPVGGAFGVSGVQQVQQPSQVASSSTAATPAGGNNFNNNADAQGRRVRLRPKPGAMTQIIGNSPILAPIAKGNGMFWPYQPMISYQQEVDYQQVDMTHTNQEFYAYKRTSAVKLSVEGEFTVQNQSEGLYALACIHFLRTVSKMYFGQTNSAPLGTPPPVLLFDAYGQYMFNQLPVIVTQFSVTMPKEPDYVPIDLSNLGQTIVQGMPTSGTIDKGLTGNNGYVWLPAVFSITVALTVQNTPARLRQFNLDTFRSGALLKNGGWL